METFEGYVRREWSTLSSGTQQRLIRWVDTQAIFINEANTHLNRYKQLSSKARCIQLCLRFILHTYLVCIRS